MSSNKDTPAADQKKDDKSASASIQPRSFWQTINPGYVVAGIATIITSCFLNIGKNFHKILEADGHTKAIDEGAAAAHKKYNVYTTPNEQHITNKYDEAVRTAQQSNTSVEKAIQQARKELIKEVEESGEIKGAIKGTWQKWNRLRGHQKLQIAATFTTVTAIAMGAIYSFQRERRLTEKLHQQIAQNADQQQQLGM